MKKNFLLVIMILIVTLTSCTASNKVYTCKINKEIYEIDFCEFIMKNAKECYDADYGKYATDDMKKVAKSSKIKRNGDTFILNQMVINVNDDKTETQEVEIYTDVSDTALSPEIVEHVRKRVLTFIEKTDFFMEKEELKEFIKEIPIYDANIVNLDIGDAIAIFDYDSQAIYIDKNIKKDMYDEMLEQTLTHEFIHALASRTNGGDKNKRYATGMFDELQTEVIAQSLCPYQSENFKMIYTDWLYWILEFYHVVGDEAIEAYFYGYDEFSEEFLNELDLFEVCMDAIWMQDNLTAQDKEKLGVASLLILKWYYDYNA